MSLIEQVADVIDSPNTDNASMALKNGAWNLIAQEYANLAHSQGITVPRSLESLKRCWTNLKYRYGLLFFFFNNFLLSLYKKR